MSSFTVDYNVHPEGEKRIVAALKDCKQWLGTKQYRKVVRILTTDRGRTPRNFIYLGLAMQGIQGYPAEVMVQEFWSPQRDLFDAE